MQLADSCAENAKPNGCRAGSPDPAEFPLERSGSGDPALQQQLHEFLAQKPALPGVRANGITSRMFGTPVTNISMRSKPSPKPACGTVP